MFDADYIGTGTSPATGVVRITRHFPGISYGDVQCTGILLTNRWVLTANHCFCNATVDPPSLVDVSMYGTLHTSDALYPLYTTTAEQIINHPSLDVALVKLSQTLPLPTPPTIYTGSGSDLPGQWGNAYGYGDYTYATLSGAPIGAGEDLRTGEMVLDHNGTAGGEWVTCGPVTTTALPATGPWTAGVLGSDLKTRPHSGPGDSGGPLFTGSTTSPTLVGVAHGVQPVTNPSFDWDTYLGIWTVRDWIKQTLFGVPMPSACTMPIPASAGSGKAALAEGPDGWLHIVAPQSDNKIGHWRVTFGGVTKIGTVPGATTSDAVALGLESAAAPGQPLKMGLAYRDKATGYLKYSRWSASTGWSASPLTDPISLAAGPAMAKGGPIAVVQTNKRVYVTFFDPAAATFSTLYRPPTTAPLADPTKRISVAFEPAYGGVTTIGYRTSTGDWIQSTGTAGCQPNYFCGFDPAYPNSWQSAMLAYGTGQRMMIVTTHLDVTGLNRLEDRAIYNGTNYSWGGNAQLFVGEPGVAQYGEDILLAANGLDGSLYVAKADNCFANAF
jgi:hypothetical protein